MALKCKKSKARKLASLGDTILRIDTKTDNFYFRLYFALTVTWVHHNSEMLPLRPDRSNLFGLKRYHNMHQN